MEKSIKSTNLFHSVKYKYYYCAIFRTNNNMENVTRGKIRKLIFGNNPKDALGSSVGFKSPATGLTVTKILHDSNYLSETGREKFLVLVKNTENVEFVWKEIINIGVVVEYDDPKGDPINII